MIRVIDDELGRDHRLYLGMWALEAEASLHQVQYALGHKDPRTTERYRKRKMNLDNNAVDKLSFLAREEDSAGNSSWDDWERALQS